MEEIQRTREEVGVEDTNRCKSVTRLVWIAERQEIHVRTRRRVGV